MEFLTVSMLAYEFHYANKLKSKKRGKPCFVTNPTSRRFNKNSLADFDKSRNPSQPNLPNPDYHKKHSQKEKREHRKQSPTEKWRDYHNSSWHDMSECKSQKTFFEKLSTYDLSDKSMVESDLDTSTLLA